MKYPGTESTTLEFKREIPKNDQIVKTVIAFCNQKGGKLVLGVDDDGTVAGLPEDQVERLLESLESTIYTTTSPPIIPLIAAKRVGEKVIVEIRVSAGMKPPYFRTSEGVEKGAYIRLGRSTLLARSDAIEELKMKARGRHFDESIVYQSSIENLDQKKFASFLEERKVGSGVTPSEEAYQAYNLIASEHAHQYATAAGLLLFGSAPSKFFPEAFIICTNFKGNSGRNVLATRDCTGPLFDQFHDAFNWILSRLNRSFTISGMKRDEQLEIPPEAIRETLLNALIHRNYRIPGPTKIAIYDDRVEIFSPGVFPGPLTVTEQTVGITYIRNHAIAKVFREAQYVEKLGSGLPTLFRSYREYGLEPPKVIEGEGFVKAILPRRKLVSGSSPRDEVLRLIRSQGQATMNDMVQSCKLTRSTAKRIIDDLLKEGEIVREGRGRATHYKLTA